MRAAVVVATLLAVACGPDEPPATGSSAAVELIADTGGVLAETAPEDALLSPDGWGPLRIGMSREEIVAALGDDANPGAVGGPDPEACDQFAPTGAPAGMLLMVENDTLTRITLMRGSHVRTERGFALGDSAAIVMDGYGRLAVRTPHMYREEDGAYITVWTSPPGGAAPARGIVYEVYDDTVAYIHAGGESIRYVEGCL
ncbi:MAG TPA: hypothetical protein VF039_15205 [Longimicrobiales bacterium]